MKHLSIEDIIEFVSAERLDDTFLELAEKVNGHIRECEECLELVSAIQAIYDEFTMLLGTDDFKGYVLKKESVSETAEMYLHDEDKKRSAAEHL